MNLLLVCETAIIEHIFQLVCKKINLNLSVQNNTNIENKYDLIIIDQNFIDDKFNIIKQFSKKLGAISSEELSFDKSRDFIIPRPFLPTKLEQILKEQLSIINEERFTNKNAYHDEDEYLEDESVTIPVLNYVETLADDIYNEIEEESDESIVNLASIRNGGVLDSFELSKISEILKDDVSNHENKFEKSDWKNISEIIDDALEEVREYEFNLEQSNLKAYNLVLNKFQIDELRPLLEKLDQEIIDKLALGEEIDLKLILKEKN